MRMRLVLLGCVIACVSAHCIHAMEKKKPVSLLSAAIAEEKQNGREFLSSSMPLPHTSFEVSSQKTNPSPLHPSSSTSDMHRVQKSMNALPDGYDHEQFVKDCAEIKKDSGNKSMSNASVRTLAIAYWGLKKEGGVGSYPVPPSPWKKGK